MGDTRFQVALKTILQVNLEVLENEKINHFDEQTSIHQGEKSLITNKYYIYIYKITDYF